MVSVDSRWRRSKRETTNPSADLARLASCREEEALAEGSSGPHGRPTSSNSVHVRPRRRELGVHVGDLALHELEGADRLAKLLAVVDVGYSDL